MQNDPVLLDQQSAAIWLRKMSPRSRFTIGLLTSAILGYYVPILLIAMTGRWVNALTDLVGLGVAATILILQNLIGNRLKRIMSVGVSFAFFLSGLMFFLTLLSGRRWVFKDHWPDEFLPIVACLINAWLLARYKNVVNL
jgi:hypothetical protein